MKQLVKNGLTVLLVIGAALIFSFQLRWLAGRDAARFDEREQARSGACAVVSAQESAEEPADSAATTEK
ncbi:MAG: hypothetical protein LIO45_02830 [Clostridiales bacterium]|nr:hypothetical protein [Clostridiales bacterium]